MNDRCSYPLSVENHNVLPCNRVAVATYSRNGETLFRCRLHDTPRVRATADEKGYAREEIEQEVAAA